MPFHFKNNQSEINRCLSAKENGAKGTDPDHSKLYSADRQCQYSNKKSCKRGRLIT